MNTNSPDNISLALQHVDILLHEYDALRSELMAMNQHFHVLLQVLVALFAIAVGAVWSKSKGTSHQKGQEASPDVTTQAKGDQGDGGTKKYSFATAVLAAAVIIALVTLIAALADFAGIGRNSAKVAELEDRINELAKSNLLSHERSRQQAFLNRSARFVDRYTFSLLQGDKSSELGCDSNESHSWSPD